MGVPSPFALCPHKGRRASDEAMRSGSEAICVLSSQPFEGKFDRSDDIVSSSFYHLLLQLTDRPLDDPNANTLRGNYRQLLYIVPGLKKQDIP